MRRLKAENANDLEIKRAVAELKARKKVLEGRVRLYPTPPFSSGIRID